MTILVQKVTKAADLSKLREVTSGILGNICWSANLSYGDELCLHIGAKLPYSQKSMAGQEKGAWILGTRGTAWRLDSASETLTISEGDPKTIRQKIHALAGTAVTAFEISYPDLALAVTFSNGYKLMLFPERRKTSICPTGSCSLPRRCSSRSV